MKKPKLQLAIEKLQEEYEQLDFVYENSVVGSQTERTYQWPGPEDEDILVCVYKKDGEQEVFHRHDFFYFHYTYKGQYDSLSYKYDHKITIRENELYAGQPYAGHAMCVSDSQETIVFGVMVRRDTFFRSFLPMLSANSKLFHFFIDPTTNYCSEEFLHLKIENSCMIRKLLEMMVIEYAFKRSDTQDMLKPLVLAFLMEITRQYADTYAEPIPGLLSERIVQYMSAHVDSVTLKDIAAHFSYHPNYISTLMRKELNKSFSEILLEQRMERAVALLRGTSLPVEEIAWMLGYSNSSNFHKAFREMYHCSPREYTERPHF